MVKIDFRTKKIRLILIILLVVGVLMLIVGGFMLSRYSSSKLTATPNPTQPDSPKSTTPNPTIAPDFTGVDVVTNETISLTQFKGSVILLNFVNYGCSSSLNQIVSAQLLAIRDLSKQRDDFVPISVFCGCCPPDVLREFALQNGLSWPWILDTNNSILPQYADYLREYGYPTLIFIDEDQHIREVTGYCDVSTLGIKIDGTR